jgi:hypothetical protein
MHPSTAICRGHPRRRYVEHIAGTLLNREAHNRVHTAASGETERAEGVSRVAHLHGVRLAHADWKGEREQRLPEEAAEQRPAGGQEKGSER